MADAFIGEIRAFPYQFAPVSWFPCDGRQLSIQQYSALYAVIVNSYGGDLQTYFNIPDFRGRVVVGAGQGPNLHNYRLGQVDGNSAVTLTNAQMPVHTHSLEAKSLGYAKSPTSFKGTPTPGVSWISKYLDLTTNTVTPVSNLAYNPNPPTPPATAQPTAPVTMHPAAISAAGGGNGHPNEMPYLAISLCICWDGYFPSRP